MLPFVELPPRLNNKGRLLREYQKVKCWSYACTLHQKCSSLLSSAVILMFNDFKSKYYLERKTKMTEISKRIKETKSILECDKNLDFKYLSTHEIIFYELYQKCTVSVPFGISLKLERMVEHNEQVYDILKTFRNGVKSKRIQSTIFTFLLCFNRLKFNKNSVMRCINKDISKLIAKCIGNIHDGWETSTEAAYNEELISANLIGGRDQNIIMYKHMISCFETDKLELLSIISALKNCEPKRKKIKQ